MLEKRNIAVIVLEELQNPCKDHYFTHLERSVVGIVIILVVIIQDLVGYFVVEMVLPHFYFPLLVTV